MWPWQNLGFRRHAQRLIFPPEKAALLNMTQHIQSSQGKKTRLKSSGSIQTHTHTHTLCKTGHQTSHCTSAWPWPVCSTYLFLSSGQSLVQHIHVTQPREAFALSASKVKSNKVNTKNHPFL